MIYVEEATDLRVVQCSQCGVVHPSSQLRTMRPGSLCVQDIPLEVTLTPNHTTLPVEAIPHLWLCSGTC